MKKLYVVILIAALLLCSCNSNLPKGMTQKVYDYGIKAVDLIDQYFAGTLSRTDAQKQLEDLCIEYNKDKGTRKSEINISPSMEAIAALLELEQGEENISSVNYSIYSERNDISGYLELESLTEFPKIVQKQ